MNIKINECIDLKIINEINDDAFENYGKDEIQILISDLLKDETARPLISLVAYDDDKAVGHILFTKARNENKKNSLSTYILAPLGVKKSHQNRGVGGQLINKGKEILQNMGVDIIFVLGHIDYYPKYGFINNSIEKIGYKPTYDIEEKYNDAWMYMPLIDIQEIKKYPGRVICANGLDNPVYWRE